MRSFTITSLLVLGLVFDAAVARVPSSLHRRVAHANHDHAEVIRRIANAMPAANSTPEHDRQLRSLQDRQQRRKKRETTKTCKPRPTATSSSAAPAKTSAKPSAAPAPAQNVADKPSVAPKPSASAAAPAPAPAPPKSGGSKLDQIKNMYAFSGFVYALNSCPSQSQAASDFAAMKKTGARTVITFDICQGQDQQTVYSNMIKAAQQAGIMIIPLIWTLQTNIQSNMGAVVAAVKANPGPVLAVCLGDEPLYDNDFGSVGSIVSSLNSLKGSMSPLGIPVSLTDMAFGWQQAGDISSIADTVDFFLMNNFPYFAGNAGSGNSPQDLANLKSDVAYFESISQGKPLLMAQTGWPRNKNEFPSQNAVASVSAEQNFWNMLDQQCSSFFKAKNIGWMWRSWNDDISGWGANGEININAKTSC